MADRDGQDTGRGDGISSETAAERPSSAETLQRFADIRFKAEGWLVYPLNRDECLWLCDLVDALLQSEREAGADQEVRSVSGGAVVEKGQP